MPVNLILKIEASDGTVGLAVTMGEEPVFDELIFRATGAWP